ncbi:hypothetical protein QFZ60_002362 [Arthrobacter sp. B2I5]|nr:hypothetical protein [Arthrobacter sp. B2I5]
MQTMFRSVSVGSGIQLYLGVATAAEPAQGLPGFLPEREIMRTSAKIVTALSVTGLALAAGSAFTGAGLVNAAGPSQFVGGTVNQTVTGATLTNLQYGFTDGTKTAVNKVTLTFAPGAEGKTVNVSLAGGATPAAFSCTAIDIDGLSICDAATGTSQSDVDGASVTVADAV